jgi:hypothetical protein
MLYAYAVSMYAWRETPTNEHLLVRSFDSLKLSLQGRKIYDYAIIALTVTFTTIQIIRF